MANNSLKMSLKRIYKTHRKIYKYTEGVVKIIITIPHLNIYHEIKQCTRCKNKNNCPSFKTYGNRTDLHCYEEIKSDYN